MQRLSRPSLARVTWWLIGTLLLAPLLVGWHLTPAQAAATFPAGFTDSLVVGLEAPTALAFTPDGRLLIATQFGRLYVSHGDTALFKALELANICATWERGLTGIAVDPAFATNRFIYLYYARVIGDTCDVNVPAANRVSRFTLQDDDIAVDEVVLIDNIPTPTGQHNGGDLAFGRDGYLYVSVGDGGRPETARQPHALNGKILRIAPDGTIPPTNPYQGLNSVACAASGGTTEGYICGEIYASGLRNPFRFAFDPNAVGTRFFINDVGQNTWEEIDEGQAGADYGWNVREGHCAKDSTDDCDLPPAGMTNPLYDYNHASGCNAITGGAFIPTGVWPAHYAGDYLFSDYGCGKLFTLHQGTGGAWTATEFASGLGSSSAVHLQFGPYCGGQALYYTSYANGGEVRRLAHDPSLNCAPTAALEATPISGPAPLTISFSAVGSSDPNQGDTFTYFWDFGDGASDTTTIPLIAHTYLQAGIYTATLWVRDDGGLLSAPATVQLGVDNSAPVAVIDVPATGAFYTSGQTYTLSGGATDEQDGPIPGERLRWTVILHHNTHTHPLFGPVSGTSVTFTAPYHEEGTTWLEVRLTATDAEGFGSTVSLPLLRLIGFTDVAADDPAALAVEQLGAHGVIRGYGQEGCTALERSYPCFGPDQTNLRAQMAALIVRAMGWSDESAINPFTDGGEIAGELWDAVAILAARGVARGYNASTFGPSDTVSQVQAVSFITRAMVARGYWQAAMADDPAIYPDVPVSTGQRLDLVTYVSNAGSLPDYPAGAAWGDWFAPATRGWFARVFWQALGDHLVTLLP